MVVEVAAETNGKMCFRRSKIARTCYIHNLAAHHWALGQLEVAGSVDIRRKMCSDPGCPIRASFKWPGQRASKCAAHKYPGMVRIRRKRCTEPGCTIMSSFNFPGLKTLKCAAHMVPGMVKVN